MPYKKSYKRRVYRRKTPAPWYKKPAAMAVGALGGVALSVLKSKLGLNTEKHWLDTLETNVATASTAQVMANPLVIPIGDTVNTRSGNTVRLTSLVCKGRIQANTAATTGCLVRVLIVHYKYPHGSTVGVGNILDQTARITSPYNMGDSATSGDYKVLYDKTFRIAVNGQTGDVANFNFTYRPLKHHLKWDSSDTTGALTSLIDGQVRGIIMTSETGANPPNYWCDWRVKFVDN